MVSRKKKQIKLDGINSFFNAIKDYFLFLVTLSSGFEILATILDGLSQVNSISQSDNTFSRLTSEFPFLFNLSSAGLTILFIGGLIPSTLGLFSISFGRKFIIQEDIEKVESIYLLVKRLATTASICFLIGFSLISTQTLFESILFTNKIFSYLIFDIAPILLIFILVLVISFLVRIIVKKDNDS